MQNVNIKYTKVLTKQQVTTALLQCSKHDNYFEIDRLSLFVLQQLITNRAAAINYFVDNCRVQPNNYNLLQLTELFINNVLRCAEVTNGNITDVINEHYALFTNELDSYAVNYTPQQIKKLFINAGCNYYPIEVYTAISNNALNIADEIGNLNKCISISSYAVDYYCNNFDSFDHMVNYFNAHYFVYYVDYTAQTIYHSVTNHTTLTHTAKMVTNAVSNIVNGNGTDVDYDVINLFINEVGYNNSSNHLIAHIVNAAKVNNVTVNQATMTVYYALGGTNL